jgi:hypothetical protein
MLRKTNRVQQYRKANTIFEAIQYDGTWDSIKDFIPAQKVYTARRKLNNVLYIRTRVGDQKCVPWDYVIKETEWSFFSCNPNAFQLNYRLVKDY